MTLTYWAVRWGISEPALRDLQARMGMLDYHLDQAATPPRSEAAVQANTRLEASRRGERVWRNNLGAYTDEKSGQFIRYGLANDSKQVNDRIKSADLIGIRPLIIGPEHIGHRIGQFVSYECKHEGWKYTGSDREVAQAAWASLVLSLGGDAKFINGPGQI